MYWSSLNHIFQDNLTQYKGSKGHSATSDVIHMILWSHIYNDVGAFFSDWNHHVKLSATILHWLCKNDSIINPLKCEWAIRETDWLGLWLALCSLMTWKKKIDAILQWIDLVMPQNCACSLVVYIIIMTWSQVVRISLTSWWINPVGQPISWTDKMQKHL